MNFPFLMSLFWGMSVWKSLKKALRGELLELRILGLKNSLTPDVTQVIGFA